MAKYLKFNGTRNQEVNTVTTAAGAADADQIPSLNAKGQIDDSMLPLESTGGTSAAAGLVPVLDGTGKIPLSMMPSNIGPEVAPHTASEALAAGDFVNVYDNFAVRKADASVAGKEAHGFVRNAVASGGTATVYNEGANDQVTGQTAGRVYLSATTPGRATSTPPTGSGQVVQCLGVATSATSISFSLLPETVLA